MSLYITNSFVKQCLVKNILFVKMYNSNLNDLNNATTCNIIQALIYNKYQRRIHHACITLHTSRYLNHLPKQTTNVNCPCLNHLPNVFVKTMSKCLCRNVYEMYMSISKCLCQMSIM